MDFGLAVVGGKPGGRESRGGDSGRCEILGADGCPNTGTLGGCGLRGAPREDGRSSTRGGCVPFTPGMAGGGRESKCEGLLDVGGVGGSGRAWMLFWGSKAFSTSALGKGEHTTNT